MPGMESVAHVFRALTQANLRRTIASIDGIGAFDFIGRQVMLGNLLRVPRANASLPFVRVFYRQTSEYLWSDDQDHVHTVVQAEGG